jgi:biopolymer transport protein ExbD
VKLRRTIRPVGGPIEMTALIDVVLLLIIFFMLSSTFVLQPGVKVTPPRTGVAGGITNSRYVINVVNNNPPMIFFNDQITDLKNLAAQLAAISNERGERTVVLRADKDVSHGTVSEILGLAIRARVSVLLASDTPPPRPAPATP